MKNRIFQIVFIALSLGSQLAQAQTPPKQGEPASNPKLQYQATTVATPDANGSALSVKVELTNIGQQTVSVPWSDSDDSIHAFDIVHEKTGQVVALGASMSIQDNDGIADQTELHTLVAGQSLSKIITIGGNSGPLSAYFRQLGRYIVRPSLVITSNRSYDITTESIRTVENAWTGVLPGDAIAFEITIAPKEPISKNTLVGSTISAAGTPISKARIQLLFSNDGIGTTNNVNSRCWDQTYSDSEGKFEFHCVPDQVNFQISVWHPDHPYLVQPFRHAEFHRGDKAILKLPQAITVRGRVIDSNKKPIFGATAVNYESDIPFYSRTNANGEFRFLNSDSLSDQEVDVEIYRVGKARTRSSVDRQKAQQGDWTIEMKSEWEMQIRGQAVFADGSPVAKSTIDLVLTPKEPDKKKSQNEKRIRITTDESGCFSILMPGTGEFQATATAHQSLHNSASRSWNCNIPSISLESGPIEFRFENRGVIQVHLFGTKNVPESVTCSTSLYSINHNKVVSHSEGPSFNTEYLFDNLEPGEYRIRFAVKSFQVDIPETKIVVPNAEPFFAMVKMQFPKIDFGGLKAKLLMPDGKTPASNIGINISTPHSEFNRRGTDADGMLQVPHLPVGKVWVSVPGVIELSPTVTEAIISDGETTDLGTVRIRKADEDFGWIEGAITYEGGIAVDTYHLMGFYRRFNSVAPWDGLKSPRVGTFRDRIPKGRDEIVFQWHGIGLRSSSFPDGNLERSLIVSVDVQAGKTALLDLKIPRLEDCRDVTVRWTGLDSSSVFLWTEPVQGMRWKFAKYGTGTKLENRTFTMKDIPRERGFLMATNSGNQSTGMFAIKSIPEGKSDIEVEFKSDELSAIEVDIVDSNGLPMQDIKVQIDAQILDEKIPVAFADRDRTWTATSLNTVPRQSSVRVNSLGEGRYSVTVSAGNWEHTTDIELGTKSTSIVKLQYDSSGKLLERQSNVMPPKN